MRAHAAPVKRPAEAGLRMPVARRLSQIVPYTRFGGPTEAPRRPASECRRPAILGKTYHRRDAQARRRSFGGRPPNAGGPPSTYHKRDSEARRRPDGGRPPNAGGPPSLAERTINAIRRPDGGRPLNAGGPPSLAKRTMRAHAAPVKRPAEAGLRMPVARRLSQIVPYTRFGGPRRLGTL